MMTSKRRCMEKKQQLQSIDDLRKLLSSNITTHESAELAVLWLMREYRSDLTVLQQSLLGAVLLPFLHDEGLNVSLANVQYHTIAEFVGLHPLQKLKDIKTFDLYRSRIPTHLFKSIVEDMDVLLIQYGPLYEQKTEETRSRFLSPIYNRLVAEFGFAFRNLPELIIKECLTTKGRVEYYFRAFGSISVLVIEVKWKICDHHEERLSAIAQIIAELDACNWNNSTQGFYIPVLGILCDGTSFEFFSFDGKSDPPSFTRGCLPGDPLCFRRGLRLSDFTLTGPALFIRDLRQICEVIFDLLLGAYISSLAAFRSRSEQKVKREDKPRKSLEKWDEALKHAQDALAKFRDAGIRRQGNLIDIANTTVDEGMKALKLSIELSPLADKTDLIMSGWDDVKVAIE